MTFPTPSPTMPLERYVELLVEVLDVLHDPGVQAARLAPHGVPGPAWVEARAAWTATLANPLPETSRYIALLDAALVARAQRLAGGVATPATVPSAPTATAAPVSGPARPGPAPVPVEAQVRQIGHEVGRGLSAGVSALGGFFDSLSKAATAPTVGAAVLVQWSDGKRYPGKVVQLAQGQCEVEMEGGSRHWIPLQYVSTT
jgi:hypothetical protein